MFPFGTLLTPPFSCGVRPRAPKVPRAAPSALPRRAAPTENYPLQRGACHSSYFFISPLFLFPRSSTHRLQYYHLPLFQACHPPLLRRASLPLFFFFHSDRRRRRRRGGTRPLIYTCTSDHNINFNDGRDENIRTPRYLWRLSWLPSTSFSRICAHVNPLPSRGRFSDDKFSRCNTDCLWRGLVCKRSKEEYASQSYDACKLKTINHLSCPFL